MSLKAVHREHDLYPIWELFCRRGKRTTDRRLHGIYAGQLNIFEGPDYQGAEFELDGRIYRGDVEIHRFCNEWYQHRHHLDRRYDNVVLHLVWDDKTGVRVCNSKMQNIETVSFGRFPKQKDHILSEPVCQIGKRRKANYLQKLKQLAIQRLKYKVSRIKKMLQSASADQVLYTLLMQIVGGPVNAKNFEQLSLLLPWEFLLSLKFRYHYSEAQWRELFLWKSGLLKQNSVLCPNDRHLPKLFSKNNSPALSAYLWQTSGNRPENQPVHQLQKFASWFFAYTNKSLYLHLKDVLYQRLDFGNLITELTTIFRLNPHRQLADSRNYLSTKNNDTWGLSKIVEIIGNVVIPFFYHESLQNDSYGFSEYIIDFYFYLPQKNRYGKLRSFNNWRNWLQGDSLRFYVNQALLQLKLHYCDPSDCSHCPLLVSYKEIDINLENI